MCEEGTIVYLKCLKTFIIEGESVAYQARLRVFPMVIVVLLISVLYFNIFV